MFSKNKFMYMYTSLKVGILYLQTTQTKNKYFFLQDYVEMESEVWKKVEVGYQQSVLEITELLHKKLQYLAGIHIWNGQVWHCSCIYDLPAQRNCSI